MRAFHPALLLAVFLCLGPTGRPAHAQTSEPDTLGTSRILLPALFYTPETKIGGGGVAAFYRRLAPGAPTSSLLFSLLYTQRGQVIVSAGPDLYLDRYHLTAYLQYADFPDLFFGVGPEARDEQEESFTARTFDAAVLAQRSLGRSLRAGPQVFFRRRTFSEVEEGGALAAGDVPGSDDAFAAGLGASAEWDTRDNAFFPARGAFAQAHAMLYDGAFGSDYDFWTARLDARAYLSLAPRRVLALHGFAAASDGAVPFHLMPSLGGANLLRGYYDGRYRDRVAVALQGAFRFPVKGRFGAEVFAGVGQVGGSAAAFHLDGLKYAGGAGLRFRVGDEGVNLRLDYAVGPGTSGTYITLQEAF